MAGVLMIGGVFHARRLYRLWVPSYEYISKGTPVTELRTMRRRHHTPPLFVPHHQIGMFLGLENPGFGGIFMFDQRHIDFAYEHGELWDGTQLPCYSDFLFIDLDRDGQNGCERACQFFREYDYLIYASGGGDDRFHFIVPHNLICNINLTACYQGLLANADIRHDFSVWDPTVTPSLPGQRHPETGKPKALIKANIGKQFRLPDDVTPDSMLKYGLEFFRRTT